MSKLTLNTLLVISKNAKDVLFLDPKPAISLWLTQKHRYIKRLLVNDFEDQDCKWQWQWKLFIRPVQTEFLAFLFATSWIFFWLQKNVVKPNTAYLFNTLRKLVIIRSVMLNLDMACKILDQYAKWHMVLKNFFRPGYNEN